MKIWATACKHAQKAIFLRAGTAQKQPYLYPFRWRLKRTCDFFAAVILLLVLSPVILGLIAWQGVKSPQSPVFIRPWRVGKRGQLFQLLKFDSLATVHHAYWQNLPQLFNVLRGEMSLVGARPWTLIEVTYLQPKQLNTLPGITGLPQIEATFAIDRISAIHLAYFSSWSLAKDLSILLQTIPRTFFGSIN